MIVGKPPKNADIAFLDVLRLAQNREKRKRKKYQISATEQWKNRLVNTF